MIIRKDEHAVSPVIATILMVAITVVLAAVLYVMVTGLLTGPGTGPRSLGVVLGRTTDQSNWSIEIISVPAGGVSTEATLTIVAPGGGNALAGTKFVDLVFATHGAVFSGDGDVAVEIGERVLINISAPPTAAYGSGHQIRIADSGGILFSGSLT